ncbi:NINE protein [uncultured Pseudoteredinibacter sp.]|uniref:NINE protein n=1 Tax=uncultured Pseudoteredinibacter sp. TaxID=1641701 RepID=UPI002623DB16|nr:NINE protein [uncultured Pseudoteredinibacter sp.]
MDQYCSECGGALDEKKFRCTQCGLIQDSFSYKSRVAASVMAISFGMFGAHRFYLGQWWGIIYLLFFWTYIPAIIGWVEGIVFLSTNQKNWNKKYNHGLSAGSESGRALLVLFVFVFIAIVGILAAVALPAYQDYTHRTKVTSALQVAKSTMPLVEDYAYENQRWPNTEDLSLDPVSDPLVGKLSVQEGAIVVTMSEKTNIEGYIAYVPTSDERGIEWSCKESTIAKRLLPAECRAD